MNRFEQTKIWQQTLGKQLEPDKHEKERELLRVEFENFREKAKLLAGEIGASLPEFTVHDISHIDALWETANLVLEEDHVLTPSEAFVLGGSFLIHDLGMGLAAFPGGIDELKKEAIWMDTVASSFRKKYDKTIHEDDLKDLDKEIEKYATENVLRLLHAKHAEKLGLISWENNKGDKTFLIENSELRESYGNIIGLIAHSHWWSVKELEEKLSKTLGAPGILPSDWIVDPVKLACILRIADAIQVDDRRAPSFLRKIRKLGTYSDAHWNFQQKLYQPRLERNRVIFSSKSPFNLDEVASWWVCYDTLKMIDNELKEVDSLLADSDRARLNAIGVASIEDPQRLSRLITVKDWQPVDTHIQVSNVGQLVRSLGGKQLYGDNILVPLRELIQNSSDAIRARRLLEEESEEFGRVIVNIGQDDYGNYIEIEDNGIGMSPKVLTGPFLDFGQSFWGTSMMHQEIPGLESKGFVSTGKYGIGFFSTFMLGEKVIVTSKRFEAGRDSSLTLEFKNGINSRPLLRKATDDEILKDGGTKIKVWVDKEIIDRLLENRSRRGGYKKINLKELIETLCPSIDCNIDFVTKGKIKRAVIANDWISMTPINLVKRIMGKSIYKKLSKKEKKHIKKVSRNMSFLYDEHGNKVGRGFVYKKENMFSKESYFPHEGIVTLGGFRSCGLTGLIGIFIGKPARASRDVGIPIVTLPKLGEWATDQATKLGSLNLDSEIQMDSAAVIRVCKGDTGPLKIATHKSGVVNYEELKNLFQSIKKEKILVVQDAAISNYERDNQCKIEYKDNLVWVQMGIPGLLQTGRIRDFIWWPEGVIHDSLEELVLLCICEYWNCSMDELKKSSKISEDDHQFYGKIGKVEGKKVIMDHINIMLKP